MSISKEMDYKCQILVIIPTYKKAFTSESATLRTLRETIGLSSSIKVGLWNNGPHRIHDDLDFGKMIDIVNQLTNDSLAKAYNYWIELIEADYYVILDDDTNVSLEFFSEIEENFASGQTDMLMLPRIKNKSMLISPLVEVGSKAMSPGVCSTLGFRAIGSGLVIPKTVVSIWEGPIFDDSLSLYGIDTVFCYDYEEMFDTALVLNTELEHDVAGLSSLSDVSYVFREKNLLFALIYIFSKYPSKRTLYFKRIIGVVLKYIIRIKSLDILKVFCLSKIKFKK